MPVAFIAGATGYTGRRLVDELAAGKSAWRARPHARREGDGEVVCDPHDVPRLTEGMRGCDAVVQLIGTVRKNFADGNYQQVDYGTTVALLEAAKNASVPRFLLLSAVLADKPRGEYLKWKRRTEECVENSGLRYTIVRPSFISGPGRGLNRVVGALAGWSARLRGIDVAELAHLFVVCLEQPERVDGKILEGRPMWDLLRK